MFRLYKNNKKIFHAAALATTVLLSAHKTFADDALQHIVIEEVKKQFADLKGPDGKSFLPEGESLPDDVVPEERLVQAAIRTGAVSGTMELCGMDWQNNSFLPFMTQMRFQENQDQIHLAFLAAAHGMVQQIAHEMEKNDAECQLLQQSFPSANTPQTPAGNQ